MVSWAGVMTLAVVETLSLSLGMSSSVSVSVISSGGHIEGVLSR